MSRELEFQKVLGEFRVLYLEDEEDLLQIGTEILADFFEEVLPARSVDVAMERMGSASVDLIVSDIRLGSENGIEFVRKVRERPEWSRIPVILTTAYTDTEFLLDAITLKVERYLIKPVEMEELLEVAYEALLPGLQRRALLGAELFARLAGEICESKQMEVLRFLLGRADSEWRITISYAEIMERIEISKPTLVKLFSLLIERGLMRKEGRGRYRIETERILSGWEASVPTQGKSQLQSDSVRTGSDRQEIFEE